jgi:hypothetical protein
VKQVPISKRGWTDLTSSEQTVRLRYRKVYFEVRSGRMSLEAASRYYHVKPETVRRHIDGFVKKGGRWCVKSKVKNEASMKIITNGNPIYIVVPDTRQASIVGRYHNAVKNYLSTHDDAFLEPFKGVTIRDSYGQEHELETDLEALYDLWERRPMESLRPIYDED